MWKDRSEREREGGKRREWEEGEWKRRGRRECDNTNLKEHLDGDTVWGAGEWGGRREGGGWHG